MIYENEYNSDVIEISTYVFWGAVLCHILFHIDMKHACMSFKTQAHFYDVNTRNTHLNYILFKIAIRYYFSWHKHCPAHNIKLMNKEICKNMLCTPFVIRFMTLVCKQHSSQKSYFALMQTVTNGQSNNISLKM